MRCLIIIVGLFFLAGCGPPPIYTEHQSIEETGWLYDEAIKFTPTVTDTSSAYELLLHVEHSTDYSFENIYFKIKTLFPDRDPREENLNIDLADKKGLWLGDCSGKQCKHTVYLLEQFKFPTPGKYTFEVEQFTRKEPLLGIEALQLELFTKETQD